MWKERGAVYVARHVRIFLGMIPFTHPARTDEWFHLGMSLRDIGFAKSIGLTDAWAVLKKRMDDVAPLPGCENTTAVVLDYTTLQYVVLYSGFRVL